MLMHTALVLRIVSASWPILRRACGWRAAFLVLQGFVDSRRLAGRTRWAARRDAEAGFARALALLPALALRLRSRIGDGSRGVEREMIGRLLAAEHRRVTKRARLAGITDPRERWHAFFDHGFRGGLRAFDEVECAGVEVDRFHVRVQRCVMVELFREAGAHDLVHAVCTSNALYCAGLLPAPFRFRGEDLSGRTLARGHAHCDYVWDGSADAGALPIEGEEALPGEQACLSRARAGRQT